MSGGNKFSQVPEWVIDADISDTAFRLYAVLLRYADKTTGKAYPGRATLAERIRKGTSAVDRALKDLTRIGAVKVVPRYQEGSSERRSNEYVVYKKQPHKVASKTNTGGLKNEATVASKTKRGVASKTTQRTIPTMNDTHTKSIPADAGPQPTEGTMQGELIPTDPKPQTPEHWATDQAYQATGKAFNFIAIRGIAKWLIHERGITPEQTAQAIVDVYKQGKPLIKQTLGQHVDGHTGSQKTSYNEWANIGNQLQNYADQKGWTA